MVSSSGPSQSAFVNRALPEYTVQDAVISTVWNSVLQARQSSVGEGWGTVSILARDGRPGNEARWANTTAY